MVNIEEAKKNAIYLIGKEFEKVNVCKETEKAYIFDNSEEVSFDGALPIVILKADGDALTMTQYYETIDDSPIIKEHKI